MHFGHGHDHAEADREVVSAAALEIDPRRVRAAHVKLARKDPARFAEYVLRHERTGKPIRNNAMHDEWHDLMSRHRRLIVWSHVEAGKTQQISVARTLFELGNDPNKRGVILGNSHTAAVKIVRSIGQYVERSEQLREVFPGLKKATPWTQTALTVERPVFSKDPSVQAAAIHGDIIGSRIDFLIIDDVLDYENTRSAEMRKEHRTWLQSAILGRLTADAPVWIVGNAYYADDLLHWLAESMGYAWIKYPVMDDAGRIAFPEEWSADRIEKKIQELGGPGSAEAERQLFCKPRSEGDSRLKEKWVQACLARGEGVNVLADLTPETTPEGAVAHTGVDIGVKKKKKSGKTVAFSILSYPNGDRQVIGVKSGRFDFSQIVGTVLEEQRRFCSLVFVEDNGAQDFVLQGAHAVDPGAELVVQAFHTGVNKTHPVFGVESLFGEMAREKWIIPSRRLPSGKLIGATKEIREWLSEALAYTPETHTGDHLMASWFAKESARLREKPPTEIGVRIIGQDVTDSNTAPTPGREAEAPTPVALRPELEGWEAILRRGRT